MYGKVQKALADENKNINIHHSNTTNAQNVDLMEQQVLQNAVLPKRKLVDLDPQNLLAQKTLKQSEIKMRTRAKVLNC